MSEYTRSYFQASNARRLIMYREREREREGGIARDTESTGL